MIIITIFRLNICHILLILACTFVSPVSQAQQTDTLRDKNIYKPVRQGVQDTIRIPAPTEDQAKRMRDSIDRRLQFVRDSLIAREQFVMDSIQRRQRILDSLTFLQRELQVLLEAYCKTTREDILLRSRHIPIAGDSALGDFVYLVLPFGVHDPYTPWKTSIGLTGKSIRIGVDKTHQSIVSVQTPIMKASFAYAGGSVLIIREPAVVQKNWAGHFYKMPFDSVFLDRYKRIVRIKRYVQFYGAVNENQQGSPLFLNLSQVKQYEYGPDNQITQFQLIKFCDRWKVYEANKVCSILTYTFSKQDNTYTLVRRNDPANSYSDGTYVFDFDGNDNLKRVSFNNLAHTESWQQRIELNKDGNVSCYFDETNDIIRQSLCMIYHDKETGARYPVETITTTFEKNGISYYQKNNTTGLSRTRDKMTLEWSPWR